MSSAPRSRHTCVTQELRYAALHKGLHAAALVKRLYDNGTDVLLVSYAVL
jgi:hypothetical protein